LPFAAPSSSLNLPRVPADPVLVVFYTVATQSRQWLAILIAALTPAGILAVGLYDRDTPAYELVILYVEFAAAWAEGRAMTLEQAIDYALAEEPTDRPEQTPNG